MSKKKNVVGSTTRLIMDGANIPGLQSVPKIVKKGANVPSMQPVTNPTTGSGNSGQSGQSNKNQE